MIYTESPWQNTDHVFPTTPGFLLTGKEHPSSWKWVSLFPTPGNDVRRYQIPQCFGHALSLWSQLEPWPGISLKFAGSCWLMDLGSSRSILSGHVDWRLEGFPPSSSSSNFPSSFGICVPGKAFSMKRSCLWEAFQLIPLPVMSKSASEDCGIFVN